jgi:hypothetical protein
MCLILFSTPASAFEKGVFFSEGVASTNVKTQLPWNKIRGIHSLKAFDKEKNDMLL